MKEKSTASLMRADQQQVEALGGLFSGQAGGWPAAISGLIAHPLAPPPNRSPSVLRWWMASTASPCPGCWR